MPAKTRFDVVAFGNAIVDILARVDDAFLKENSLQKGIMTLIDAETAERLYEKAKNGVDCSGGSAANTAAGIASLGGKPAFIGKVADDSLGGVFARDIRRAGVFFETKPLPYEPSHPTGRSFVFVTDDAQRTMCTFLGACSRLTVNDVAEDVTTSSAITYIEGYLWDKPEAKMALMTAADMAKSAKRRVALSLSDPFCVTRHKSSFLELIDKNVSLIFCNEEEIKTLLDVSDLNDALKACPSLCETVVVTLGEKGAVAVSGDNRLFVSAAAPFGVVDTTGAGDLFAAGFLTAFAANAPIETCLKTGQTAAAEIISHYGARPAVSLKTLLTETA